MGQSSDVTRKTRTIVDVEVLYISKKLAFGENAAFASTLELPGERCISGQQETASLRALECKLELDIRYAKASRIGVTVDLVS